MIEVYQIPDVINQRINQFLVDGLHPEPFREREAFYRWLANLIFGSASHAPELIMTVPDYPVMKMQLRQNCVKIVNVSAPFDGFTTDGENFPNFPGPAGGGRVALSSIALKALPNLLDYCYPSEGISLPHLSAATTFSEPSRFAHIYPPLSPDRTMIDW